MTRLVFNRDGGKTDEYGHMIGFSWHIQGDVIGGLVVTVSYTHLDVYKRQSLPCKACSLLLTARRLRQSW